MRFLMWSGLAVMMLTLVSCGVSDAAFADSFQANLTPRSPSAANGMTSALIYRRQLIVSGTFSGLSSPATGAAIMDGDREVIGLIIFGRSTQGASHSGAFERFFAVAGHESALSQGSYQVRIVTEQDPAGELTGALVPLGPRPFSLDLVQPRRNGDL